MYHCLEFNDDKQKMHDCFMRIEDGHCFYCPFYYSFDNPGDLSEETKRHVLEKFIEVSKIAIKNK